MLIAIWVFSDLWCRIASYTLFTVKKIIIYVVKKIENMYKILKERKNTC